MNFYAVRRSTYLTLSVFYRYDRAFTERGLTDGLGGRPATLLTWRAELQRARLRLRLSDGVATDCGRPCEDAERHRNCKKRQQQQHGPMYHTWNRPSKNITTAVFMEARRDYRDLFSIARITHTSTTLKQMIIWLNEYDAVELELQISEK